MAGGDDMEDDLEARERQLAEDRAFELNPYGTGVDPDMDQDYDEDAGGDGTGYAQQALEESLESQELTDVDYQNDFSNDFTNYAGGDAYSNQFGGGGAEEDEGNESGTSRFGQQDDEEDDIEDFDNDAEDFDNDDDQADMLEEGEDADDGDNGDGGGTGDPGQKNQKKRNGKQQKPQVPGKGDDNKKGKIKWKPGDKIDLALLATTWAQLLKIDKLKAMIKSANEAVTSFLNTTGPNLMLKFNQFTNKLKDQSQDTISSILDLAKSNGKRLTLTVASTVEAIFDQQWFQPFFLSTLPATLEGLLAVQPLNGIMQGIFTIGVPIVNKLAKD